MAKTQKKIVSKILGLFLPFFFIFPAQLLAQHFNFSQYDLTPLRINPGLAATTSDAQLIFHYRNQETNAAQSYKSSMVTATFPLIRRGIGGGKRWGGLGISVLDDRTGTSIKFINQNIAANFAYNVNFSQNLMLSMGMQTDINIKKLSAEGVTTGMQYRDWGFNPGSTTGEDFDQFRTSNIAVSSGLFLYKIDQNKRNKYYSGISFYNLNRPNQSFFRKEDPMPVIGIITAGYRVWEEGAFELTPQFLFTTHSGNNLMNLGVVVSYDLDYYYSSDISGRLDLAFRHLVGKEGIVALQYHKPSYVIGFSYDFPISSSIKDASKNVTEIAFSLRAPIKRSEKNKNKSKKRKRNRKKKVNVIKKAIDKKQAQNIKKDSLTELDDALDFEEKEDFSIPLEEEEDKINDIKVEDPYAKGILSANDLLKTLKFDFNSATIKVTSHIFLNKLADLLIDDPSLNIKIIGHTDDIGSESINELISQKRAEAIKIFLVSKGISGERIKTEGKGKTEPKYPNINPKFRELNRRVEFEFY